MHFNGFTARSACAHNLMSTLITQTNCVAEMRESDSLLRSRVSGCHATLSRNTMSLLAKLKLGIRVNLFWRHVMRRICRNIVAGNETIIDQKLITASNLPINCSPFHNFFHFFFFENCSYKYHREKQISKVNELICQHGCDSLRCCGISKT